MMHDAVRLLLNHTMTGVRQPTTNESTVACAPWSWQPCAQAERGPLASLPGERIRPSALDETTLRRAPVNDVWAQDTQSRQSIGILSRHGHVFDISLARGWLSVGKARCAIYVGWNVNRAVPNRPKGDEIQKKLTSRG